MNSNPEPDPRSTEIQRGNLPSRGTVQLRVVRIADKSERWAFQARCGSNLLALPLEAPR